MAAPSLLAILLAAEGAMILGLIAFNAYFLSQKPILHYIREIYFLNGNRFRQAWYVVISATTFFFLIHATVFLGQVGVVVNPDRAEDVATIFTVTFGTLIILAFSLVFSVFVKYVRGLPAKEERVHERILEDIQKSLLRDDVQVRLDDEYARVGDVVTGRRQLGPSVGLAHYRALTLGFQAYLERRWGHMGDAVLYSVGRLAGRHAAGEILREAPDQAAALAQVLREYQDNGIGIPEVRETRPDRVDVVVHESAPAAGTRPLGHPLCYYQAGMFAGIFEIIHGRPATARETHCWGQGDQYCEFRVDLPYGKT